jgi:two-component sensor histidine kinase
MSTLGGISMLNESRTKFTHYDPSDGLQGREFSGRTVVKTHDGYLCYGGRNGFNIFHPDSLRKNSFIPPVILKRIMIFDEELKMDSSFTDLKKLKLSYKQNFFSFEFAALNYDHPEKNKYEYQLIGFDKKVVSNGTNRVFSYTNVPPGRYTLKVTASNNDDQWNNAGFEMELIIIPPFWATWWFKTIVVLVLVGSVFLFFRLRENRIRKEEARQTAINKQIAEIRMIALRGQMNPHFIFNSLNSIQHFITTREKEEALNYLSKFSKLIRKILENSRENTVSISNELQLLELYIQLEQLRFSNKFDYHISIDEKIDMENTEIPPLLIQPYIENAILHGLINKNDKGDLRLSLERSNGLLVCKIEDNGIGRARAKEIEHGKVARHKSLGIKVTEERISGLFELLDYKMEVVTEDLFEIKQASEETPQPAGTRVTISIPVKEEE